MFIIGTLPYWFAWLSGESAASWLPLLGIYGDMFGVLNATVSSFALVAIYYTLRLQQKQFELQREEVDHMKAMARLKLNTALSSRTRRTRVHGSKSGPDTPKGEKYFFHATYVNFFVENEEPTPARNCRAVLTEIIEIPPGDGRISVEGYRSIMGLRPSHGGTTPNASGGFDIRKGHPFQFDLLSVKDERIAANPAKTPRDGGVYTMLQVDPEFER